MPRFKYTESFIIELTKNEGKQSCEYLRCEGEKMGQKTNVHLRCKCGNEFIKTALAMKHGFSGKCDSCNNMDKSVRLRDTLLKKSAAANASKIEAAINFAKNSPKRECKYLGYDGEKEGKMLLAETKVNLLCLQCEKPFTRYFFRMKVMTGLCNACNVIFSSEGVKEKCMGEHEVEYHSQREDVKIKKEETFMKRYGVKNYTQTEECKQRTRDTNMEKRGVTCSLQDPVVKEKIKVTLMKEYGVDNPMKNKEIMKKQQNTMVERYEVFWDLVSMKTIFLLGKMYRL